MQLFVQNINVFSSFLTSLVICLFAIPSIVKIAEIKHLYDEEHSRKSHKGSIPTLGGLAMFAGLIFGISFWTKPEGFFHMKFVLSSVILIFFTGIKDDIVNLVAWKKLVSQLLAAFILSYWGSVEITSLYGLMGVHDIPPTVGLVLSVLTITLITNSFNLIDGVNCLAGGIGVVTSVTFGTWFLLAGHNSYAVLAFSMTGALLGFLWFNKTPAKIFMGDTGSLLLGLISSILAIKFIEINKVYDGPYQITSVPAVATAVLIIPLFDTVRVMAIRILTGKSPLDADRNHIHHKLLDHGLSHMQITLSLITINILFIAFGFFFMHLKGEFLLGIEIIMAITLTWIVAHFAKKRKNKLVVLGKTGTE